MFESILVGLIVGVAALYSGWQLTPVSLRQRLARSVSARCAQSRIGAVLTPALARAAGRPSGACSGCGARGQCPVGRTLNP
jgi:hypothetical protein